MKAESSPDGSILFFAHQRAHEITVWDTQTGGLVHTLTTMSDIGDISVSSKGKYLGSCSSDSAFEFWEVESRCRISHSLDQAVACICWLEPEDRVALALGQLIVVLEVTTGRLLYTYLFGGSVRRITFSARRHELGFLSVRAAEGKMGIIDIQIGAVLELPYILHDSCLALPGHGSMVICATNTGNILSFVPGYSFEWDHRLSNLGSIHSISLLRGGQLVVGSVESIQLLELEHARPPGAIQGPGLAHVYQLDTNKAICCSSEDHTSAYLLGIETMSILTNRHTKPSGFDASFEPHFLCASIDTRITVIGVRKPNSFALIQSPIDWRTPSWERPSSRPVLLGALSPDGRYLITVSGGEDSSGGGDWELGVQSVSDGSVCSSTPFIRKGRPPNRIAFASERQFYTEERQVLSNPPWDEGKSDYEDNHEGEDDCEDHHVQATLTPFTMSEHPSLTRLIPRTTMSKQPEVDHTSPRTGVPHREYHVRKYFSLKRIRSKQSSLIRVRIREMPGEWILSAQYSLDENLEWVVDTESRRVCWLPPGYVTGIEDGHVFVGSSIVTAGQDGIVRKLTFREPSSDS